MCLEATEDGGESSFFLLAPETGLEGPPSILGNSSSSTVTASPGARAVLGCTVLRASRRTVRERIFYSSVFVILHYLLGVQVSWVRVGPQAAPSLLAVGQFVFSGDARLAVTRAANTSRLGDHRPLTTRRTWDFFRVS